MLPAHDWTLDALATTHVSRARCPCLSEGGWHGAARLPCGGQLNLARKALLPQTAGPLQVCTAAVTLPKARLSARSNAVWSLTGEKSAPGCKSNYIGGQNRSPAALATQVPRRFSCPHRANAWKTKKGKKRNSVCHRFHLQPVSGQAFDDRYIAMPPTRT